MSGSEESVPEVDSAPTFDREYWDEIWDGDGAASMSTGEPNPHLVEQIQDLAPGSAVDAGCGAGAEALWLASRGWQVTGVDFAASPLALARERADASGLAGRVTWVQADLSVWEPERRYDLVTTFYAHPELPQLEFYDRIASWVGPGGTLLIVGHLHHDAQLRGEARAAHGHRDGQHDDEPPESTTVRAADITARLDPAAWEVTTAQESHRTQPGQDGQVLSLHDVVVRARRR